MQHDHLSDERHMRRALALAELGRGAVEPNPMVGAVVVDAAGTVVGEGWHTRFGAPHAEVEAFAKAGARANGGTLYVTLEPCCHFGKTPPCTDAVLKSGVSRVVVATLDPFPKVAGGGAAILRKAGITVDVGLGETEALALNAPYFKLLATGQPWVIAKWAMSLDGKIATRTGDSKWISSAESRSRVHALRGRVDAIVVGRGTVLADDPLLTARPVGIRTATRVILSRSGNLPEQCQLLKTVAEAPVLVFTAPENRGKLANWEAAGVEVVGLPRCHIPDILANLGERKFTNILVEGGAGVLGEFHDAGAVDEAEVYIAPILLGGQSATSPVSGTGIESVGLATRYPDIRVEQIGTDIRLVARQLPRKPEPFAPVSPSNSTAFAEPPPG